MNRVEFLREVRRLNDRYNSHAITRDEWTRLTELLLTRHEVYLLAERLATEREDDDGDPAARE